MKNIITTICVIVSITIFAQKMPQKTAFRMEVVNNKPFFRCDTIGHDDNGVWIRILDHATYYYNRTDSFFLRPVFYVAKGGNVMTTFEITLPKSFQTIGSAELKFNIPPCPSTSYGYKYNPVFTSKMMDYRNVTLMDDFSVVYVEIQNREYFESAYQYCTQNVELKVNGLVVVPNQNREPINYLRYTKMFVDNLSLNSAN